MLGGIHKEHSLNGNPKPKPETQSFSRSPEVFLTSTVSGPFLSNMFGFRM